MNSAPSSSARARPSVVLPDPGTPGTTMSSYPPVRLATHWSKASLLLSGLSIRPWRVHCTIASASDRIGVRMRGGQVGRQDRRQLGRQDRRRAVGRRRRSASLVGEGCVGRLRRPVGSDRSAGRGRRRGVGLDVGPGVGLLVGPSVGSGSAVGVPPHRRHPAATAAGAGAAARRHGPAGAVGDRRCSRRRRRRRRTPAPGRRTPRCGCSGTPRSAGRCRWRGRRRRSRGRPRSPARRRRCPAGCAGRRRRRRRPTTDQVEGMNCMGPTARSNRVVAVEQPGVGVGRCGRCPGCRRAGCRRSPGGPGPCSSRWLPCDAAVVRLDAADRRDQLPGQVAGGVGGVDHGLGPLVGREGGRRDAVDRGVADGVVGVALRRPERAGPGSRGWPGASIASSGTVLPSGSVPSAVARRRGCRVEPAPAMLTLAAADSRARGTRVRPSAREPAEPAASLSRGALLLASALAGASLTRWHLPNEAVTHGLRRQPDVTWSHHERASSTIRAVARREADVESSGAVGDNEPVTPPTTHRDRRSEALFARARAVTPGRRQLPGPGLQRRRRHASLHPARRAVPGSPTSTATSTSTWSARGARCCSATPTPRSRRRWRRRSRAARPTARPTEPEVELAEEIVARTPIDQVRFVSSGTEATMSAIRLARGVTGRDVVVKFAGCYHGHVDSLLARGGLAALADLRAARHPRRTRLLDRADPGAALQRPRRRDGRLRRARRPHRLRHHRGRARQHGRGPAAARLQRLPGRDLRGPRGAVRQRRGDDRLPRQQAGPVGPRRRRRGLDAPT